VKHDHSKKLPQPKRSSKTLALATLISWTRIAWSKIERQTCAGITKGIAAASHFRSRSSAVQAPSITVIEAGAVRGALKNTVLAPPPSWFPLRVAMLSLNDHGKNQEQGTSHHFSTHKLLLTGEINPWSLAALAASRYFKQRFWPHLSSAWDGLQRVIP